MQEVKGPPPHLMAYDQEIKSIVFGLQIKSVYMYSWINVYWSFTDFPSDTISGCVSVIFTFLKGGCGVK